MALALCLLRLFISFSLWWAAPPILIYIACVAYGSSRIGSGFHTVAFCGGETALKEIAVTFDDGPHAEFTPKVLDLLAQFGAPAAFFLIGKNIAGNEPLLERMAAAGHVIGNHSFSHSYLIDFKRSNGFKDELNRTSDAIYRAIGKRPRLFRPPYGVTTPHLARAAKALDYSVVGWNVRSFDTTPDSQETITERVDRQLKPGAILLFHDASEKTLLVLREILYRARARGFKVVSLERLLRIPSYR